MGLLFGLLILATIAGITCLMSRHSQPSNGTTIINPQPVPPLLPVPSQEPLLIPPQARKIFMENWTLIDFYKEFGPGMKMGECTNHHTNERYNCCAFTDKYGNTEFVGFFRQLGSLTLEELQKRKYELFVGKTRSGFYRIYDSNVKDWEDSFEDVDLGQTK